MNREAPRQGGVHLGRVEEGPPADFIVWEVAARLPLPKGSDGGTGFLIGEEDFKALVGPHEDGVVAIGMVWFFHGNVDTGISQIDSFGLSY